MDKSWQKNLLAFLGLVAAVLAIVAYVYPLGKPAEAGITQEALDNRLQSEREQIAQFVLARTAAAEGKLTDIQGSLQDFKMEMREGFKKLDDRIYQMQKERAVSAARDWRDGT